MRIIITNDGIRELSPLKDERNRSNSLKNFSPQMSSSTSLLFSKKNVKRGSSILAQSKYSFHNSAKLNLLSFSSSNTNKLSDTNPLSLKYIRINPSRLIIPKEQNDLYDNDKSKTSQIVKQTNEILTSLENSKLPSNETLPRLQNSYSLREIISDSCFKKLDNQIRKEQFDSTHDLRIDHINVTNLRKEDKNKNIFEKVEKEKNTQIESSHGSLIEYLIKRNKISVNMLDLLSSYNEDKMYKLNKICQRILIKNQEDQLMTEDIQNRIASERLKEKEFFKNKLDSMNKDLTHSKSTINECKYKKLKNQHKLIFKEIHQDFKKKYWKMNNDYKRFFYSKSSKSFKNGYIPQNYFDSYSISSQ